MSYEIERQPGRVVGEITPERFERLMGHLRVNGKPFRSVVHRMEAEQRKARPDEQEKAA